MVAQACIRRDELSSLRPFFSSPESNVHFRKRVSDSVLSKHLKVLEGAGYLDLSKRTANGRQRTWLALSRNGRKAYHAHVKELKKIVG